MRKENIERAKELTEEIKRLDLFIDLVVGREGAKAIINKETKYSIFGKRLHWYDKFESTIQIPESLLPKLREEAVLIRRDLEEELEQL